MANTYKRVISTLTSTGDNSVYTCPTATTTLVKAVKVFNDTELQSVKIDLSYLLPGTYVVQIFSEKGMTKSLKIMKQ